MDDNLNQYDGGRGPNGPGGPGNNGGPNGSGGPGGPGGNGGDPRKQSLIMLAVAAVVTLLCISMFMKMMTGELSFIRNRQNQSLLLHMVIVWGP